MRLFIAVNTSPEVKKAMLAAQDNLRRFAPGAVYVPENNFHITLAFIGESMRTAEIVKAINAADAHSFEVSVGGLGHFGSLYYVPVSDGGELSDLAESVRHQLERRRIDFDRKPFKPHITLARRVEPDGTPEKGNGAVVMTVADITLFKSERTPEGIMKYTPLYSRSLI